MTGKHAIATSLVTLLVWACGGTTTNPNNPNGPKNHRPTAMACDTTRPPGIADAGILEGGVPEGGLSNCNQDSDCTQGTNGRCGYSRVGKQCTYDTCTTDADCPNGGVCSCREGPSDTNHCIGGMETGACRVDADCGSNGACSPSLGSCGNFTGLVGYFCHTSQDTCENDSDCTAMGNGFCMYEPMVKHWQCSYTACAG